MRTSGLIYAFLGDRPRDKIVMEQTTCYSRDSREIWLIFVTRMGKVVWLVLYSVLYLVLALRRLRCHHQERAHLA